MHAVYSIQTILERCSELSSGIYCRVKHTTVVALVEYWLTVYVKSVHTIYAVPDNELIDSKHVEILLVQSKSTVGALTVRNK
jgi:hypothetical protein